MWAKSGGGKGADIGGGIAVDGAKNTYVGATFRGTATFGTTTVTSKGNQDVLLVKIDSRGKTIWARSIGSFAVDGGDGIGVDAAGNVNVAGEFSSTVQFAATSLRSESLSDIFVWKL